MNERYSPRPEIHLFDAPRRRFDEVDARSILAEIGYARESFGPELVMYMAYLGSRSNTMGDEMRARQYAEFIAEVQKGPHALSAEGWRHVDRASTFTDLGKAGPFAERIGLAQQVVTRLYAENAKWPPTATLGSFVEKFFPNESDAIRSALPTVPGVSEDMTMRAFWDAHSQWTYDILKGVGMPADVLLSASAHHVLEGENAIPKDGGVPIVNLETGRFQALGIDRALDMREVMVILIDKYEANMTRSGSTHEGAMAWLRDYVEKNAVLSRLPDAKALFEEGLDNLDRSRAGERSVDELAGRLAAK